ncbi:hypothetical protein BDB01DRAFT_404725 [Pilobolus umbonatus]|nr:hypothetical protein BDB01DRAFT_404725 [Pilobolus umbonatus]
MIHYDLLNRGGDTAEQQQAYTLCHSLSSLCNSIYRLVELSETSKYGYSEPIPPCHELNMNSLQQELHSRVTQFQAERAAGVMTIGRTASREQRMLWEEINQWMNSINEMSVSQWMPVPPPYSETIPPAYESHVPKEEYLPDKKDDLDRVIHAVHRLSTPMNDQRVIMTEQQSNDIATATLAKSIERLCQGRLDNQRCTPKQHLLQDLVHQIQSSASRTFDNQRVYLTPSQKKRIEVASMNDILNKLNKGRHTNQDAPLPKESLNKASDLLVKSMHRPNKHKFRLSSLLRLDKSKTEDDLFNIIQHMYQSKPQYDNQRASFSHPVFA